MIKEEVLNHGLIRLVDSMGSDVSIARSARVSYDAAWRAGENEGSDKKLINYLYKNGHNTPFESVEVQFEVRAPIFVFRQWHRHRCVAGNTYIHFDQKRNDGRRSLHKDTIENLYKKIHSPRNSHGYPIQGMKLRCLNEDTMEIINTNIVDIMKTGIKPMYSIESEGGKTITTTLDHLFFSERGWLPLETIIEEELRICLSTTNRDNKQFWTPKPPSTEVVWKVVYCNTSYEVSNHGNVRNKQTKKLLASTVQKDGYIRFSMCIANTRKKVSKYAHELVLEAFKPRTSIEHEVSHKDHNRYNNDLSNLSWVTHKENCDLSQKEDRHSRLVGGFEKIMDFNPVGEQVCYDIEVEAPYHNFIANSFIVHNCQSYNEISARYKELPEEFYIPELEQITTQSADNKQMRTKEQNPNAELIQELIEESNAMSFEDYHQLIELGTPREIARSVLPVGTYSHMFAKANLNNWFKFLAERLHPHAQYEIRVYAEAILRMLETIAPLAVAAFNRERHL